MSEYAHEAVFEYQYAGKQPARTIANSIRPEVGEIEGERTCVALRQEGTNLILTVRAKDLTALRAGINTWGSLVAVAERLAGA